MSLNLSTPGTFRPRTISQNQYDIEGTLSGLLGQLGQGPQNAFSNSQMEDLAGRNLRDLRAQDQEAIAGAAQAQGARGVAGPNLASVYGTQLNAKNTGAVGNANLNAILQGMNMGNQQYSAMSGLAGTLGNLENQQMARELSMILNNVRPEVAGQGMQIDPTTGLPILATGQQGTQNAAGGTGGTGGASGTPDYTGYYTTGDSTAAWVPYYTALMQTKAQPGLMTLASDLGMQQAEQGYGHQLGLNQQGYGFDIGKMQQDYQNQYGLTDLEYSKMIDRDWAAAQSDIEKQRQAAGFDYEMQELRGNQGYTMQDLIGNQALQQIGATGDQTRANTITETDMASKMQKQLAAETMLANLFDTLFGPQELREGFSNERKATIEQLWNQLTAQTGYGGQIDPWTQVSGQGE